ncbi:bifunctional DNA primase/polymerase [Streptomyces katsurahamanus]|uniref:DNA primase n=1 Tax=Streptomyces katsurahamanus TaxID=2577098 RepID=A0ABW9NWW2_9ACTN|nr:bifunctional DNA primase/polymerase [Streptomyces katsurahamanus]MQS37802.1 DNA primase [Streptomyces katsurahamanus]
MATAERLPVDPALAHALAAAERGFAVIPLTPAKLPALPSPHRDDPAAGRCLGECGLPGHGVHDATADPAGVRALFAAAPWATGYGIACGRAPHWLIGIDLDVGPSAPPGSVPPGPSVPPVPPGSAPSSPVPPGPVPPASVAGSLAALRRLALRHLFTVPETVTVLTPSGGRHLWLTGPPGVLVPNSAGRLAPGIDVRGTGGYLVGPGSVSTRGGYRFAPDTAARSPAPCPRALLRLIAPPARPHHPAHGGSRQGQGQGLVQFVLAAHEGQRNTRLFWAACRAYENGIGETLADALAEAAIGTGLSAREAYATIASARRLTSDRGR